jgi:hypothetical protein
MDEKIYFSHRIFCGGAGGGGNSPASNNNFLTYFLQVRTWPPKKQLQEKKEAKIIC